MKNIRNIIEQKYPPENPNDLWMKDNVLYKSTHKGWTPLTTGGGSSTNGVTPTTWLELKDKRDVGKLIPGSFYRITDYNCTTTQENTQSAGHQFDIVLLALSENKLAEEGWAMMNESNVYDVTFDDGVTKKCYLYLHELDGGLLMSVVDIETLLGFRTDPDDFTINEENKTATALVSSTDLDGENVPYNYFQYSNLSAWKVWYCLDNDTARFAWADTTNGKGVIYRMIDEFNNDIKYDFKNIQFKRKLTDGQYDATNGTETWCYTLNLWYNGMCQDASVVGNTLLNDEGFVNGVYGNNFGYATAYDIHINGVNTFAFALGNNVILSYDDSGLYYGLYSNTIGNAFYNNTIGSNFYNNTIGNCFIFNTIGDFFTDNVIGNYFCNNTIGNSFQINMIGNHFDDETISDNTRNKNYGNNGVELATKDDLE